MTKTSKRSTRKGEGSRAKLFNPDTIATAVAQKLDRDLSTLHMLYGGETEAAKFYLSNQRSSTLKKYVNYGSDTTDLQEKTFEAFKQTNARMKQVNLDFPEELATLSLSQHKTDKQRMLLRARALMHWVLGPISTEELYHKCRNSAGVSQGVSFKDTSPEAKFDWPISGTGDAIREFHEYLDFNETLRSAIEELNGHQHFPAERYEEVPGSRATTVDKTTSKRRMIAIEPTLNMFFQQGLMRVLYARMRSKSALSAVKLDVATLPRDHTYKAMESSITGENATIDFSSASDSVGIELLRWLLPDDWFEWVDLLRCHTMEIGGETVQLEMISTMGNAGTFPLESLVFYCLQVAAVMERTRPNPYSLLSFEEDRSKVSVFGDDCILPTADARTFMDLAESVGFVVNEEKSFYAANEGFRESCGGDYFHGTDVRPIFLSAPTSNKMSALAPWLYTILNRVLRKYLTYFGSNRYVYEKELLEYLFGLFKENNLLVRVVPPYFPDDSGLNYSRDLYRLQQTYGIRFDHVSRSQHGVYKFRYHRFNYDDKKPRNEYLAYALWLGQPTHEEPMLTFPRREKGGYLVAKSRVSVWTLESIKSKDK